MIQIGQAIVSYASWVFERILLWPAAAADIAEKILHEILQIALYWGIRAITSASLAFFFYVLPAASIAGIILRYVRSRYFDKANRWIMAATMMLVVVLVSIQKANKRINLLLLWGIVQCLVPVIRFVMPAIVRFAARSGEKPGRRRREASKPD